MTEKVMKPAVEETLVIKPINFRSAVLKIVGTSPYLQHAFSEKTRVMLEAQHREGSKAKNRTKKEPRDFEGDYLETMHKCAKSGWLGIPAAAFRNAAISACRVGGFPMTRAKLSIFVVAEGYDSRGTPLIQIYGDPIVHQATVRNETGVIDIRWRPMWLEWYAFLTIRWDGDQFSSSDIVNLIARAGLQVGIGEGRADSRDSNGQGWGSFDLDHEALGMAA